MKIERIQSPNTGGSIPVLRRAEGQESDNRTYVGATNSDPHQKRGGRYYTPSEQQRRDHTERKKEGSPPLGESSELTIYNGEERPSLLDITA